MRCDGRFVGTALAANNMAAMFTNTHVWSRGSARTCDRHTFRPLHDKNQPQLRPQFYIYGVISWTESLSLSMQSPSHLHNDRISISPFRPADYSLSCSLGSIYNLRKSFCLNACTSTSDIATFQKTYALCRRIGLWLCIFSFNLIHRPRQLLSSLHPVALWGLKGEQETHI